MTTRPAGRTLEVSVPTPVISVQHVDKTLGGKQVLRDLSIDVERGESFVIVGGSGQGKSVTLNHIIGLMLPDLLFKQNTANDICTMTEQELNRYRRHFGMAFQEG